MRVLIGLVLLVVLASVCPAQETAPLVAGTTPASVAVRMQPGLYQADLEVREATTVTLWCPVKPGLIRFTGLTQKAEVAYDLKARLLTLSLQPGKYSLTIRPL